MPAPTVDDVAEYLGPIGMPSSWSPDEIASALAAEKANQARACIVPDDDEDWPADLAEALKRRVARNLALRRAPLGITASEVESVRISGRDVEIARLEAPHRRWVVA